MRTVLLTVFAGLALVLAVIGTYGVVAYAVAQRTQEMGIRLAPIDAATFTAVALVLACATLAACYLPARRAARVHPMEALRNE